MATRGTLHLSNDLPAGVTYPFLNQILPVDALEKRMRHDFFDVFFTASQPADTTHNHNVAHKLIHCLLEDFITTLGK